MARDGDAAATNEPNGDTAAPTNEKKKGKHDKPKPWDEDPNIDHWKIDKFDPSWNEGGMLEVSSFSTLFPQYREKYLQEAWPMVKSAVKEFGVACELNLVTPSLSFCVFETLGFEFMCLMMLLNLFVIGNWIGGGFDDGFDDEED